MYKSNSTAVHSSYTRNENFTSAKEFVQELKVCTLDPARYLQRCIAVATKGNTTYTGSYMTPNISKEIKCLPSTGTLRNISVSKRSFLSEKPDSGMISNIITSRASGNCYSPQILPKFPSLTPGINTNYLTKFNAMGAENKNETPENPKILLLKMLRSAVISAKKKNAAKLNSKKKKGKKKHRIKNRRLSPHKNQYPLKDKKHNSKEVKVHKANTKAVTRISLQNAINQLEKPPPKNNMINKMLEETEEMLRITYLSNISCSSNASTAIPTFDFLGKSDTSQLVNSFISKLLCCARNINIDENNNESTSRNTFISTTVTKKSKAPVKKSITNSQSRVSAICKRKDISNTSVRKPEIGRDHLLQVKSKTKQKKDKLPIGIGRPGKDDTEEAELAHCTIQPDPPSAISAPYRERNSSTKAVSKLPQPQESVTSIKCDEDEEKCSYKSNFLQCFRDPILDLGNKTKLLPREYNSQITYVCPSTELNLKLKETESATGNGDKSTTDLSAECQKLLAPSDTSVKKPVMEQKCRLTQSVEKKTNVKPIISRAIGRIVSKSIAETRSMQQRKVSDTRNKLSDSVVQARKPAALRSNNKQIFKKQSERNLCSNAVTKAVTQPRASSSFTSGGSRYQRQQRRFKLPGKDNIRMNAEAMAERRFFNRNEHLLFLARPNTRYAENTRQRFSSVLDPCHVRNLNTIIFCNQAEDRRLKQKRKALSIEEFIQEALRNRGLMPIFEGIPNPNVSEASSLNGSASDHSFCTEADAVSNLAEEECFQDIPTEEIRRKSTLSIIQEEPEDLHEVDKYFVSISRKNSEEHLNIPSLMLDGKEVLLREKNTSRIEKDSVIELDYRISDRFMEEHRTVVVNEINNEYEDSFLVLRNLEIASEEHDDSAQNVICAPKNPDFDLPLQLYKSIETIASNISTFITIFEGLELTLQDIQENCRFRSIFNNNYITLEEIQNDCTQALLRARKTNSYTEKYGINNSIHVMRCEVFFTESTLASEVMNLCNENFDIVYHSSEKYILALICGNKEKNGIWNILATININYTPIFINKLDYYSSVLQLNRSKFLQGFINYPNISNFKKNSSKYIDITRNNSDEYATFDTSMNIPDCVQITDNIISLLLLKVFENVAHKNILLSTTNKNGVKTATPEERIFLNTGVHAGQTEVSSQSIGSKEFIDCIPRTFIPTVEFLTHDVVADFHQEHAQSCFDESQSNISAVNENDVGRYVGLKSNIDITELKPTSSFGNLTVLNKITNDFQNDSSTSKYLIDNYSKDTANNGLKTNMDITEFKPTAPSGNLTVLNKITNDFQNESNTYTYLVENYFRDTDNNTHFFKENVADDAYYKVSQGMEKIHVDDFADESLVIGSSTNKRSAECFTYTLDVPKEISQREAALKRILILKNFFKKTKENIEGTEGSHFLDSHSTHYILPWATFSENVNKVLYSMPEQLNGKTENFIDALLCHELTILSSSHSLAKKVSPIVKLDSVSKYTQTEIAIDEEENCPKRENPEVGHIYSHASSSRQTMLSKTIKYVLMASAALFTASFLPAIPIIQQLFTN